MTAQIMETRAAKYEFEIEIQASRDAVWTGLTTEINKWWLPDFHMVGEGSVVSFDTRAGGHLVETKEDGGSLLWYTVLMCAPGESVHLVGHVAPEWGGPSTNTLCFRLEEKGDATILRVQDAHFGHVADSTLESLESGWKQLFGEGLKPYVEAS